MRGFSTIEILLSLAVLSSMLIAASLLAFGTPQLIQSAYEHHGALAVAESALLAAERRSSSELRSFATTTADGYFLTLTAALLPDRMTRRLTARAFWPGDERGSAAELVSYAIDPARADGYPCDILPRGDWRRPQISVRGVAPGDLLPASWAGGAATIDAIAATRTHLALAASATSAANAPALFLFALEAREPRFRASLTVSSTTAAVAALALSPRHAYIASASTCATAGRCGQLKIVDIADNSAPRIVSQLLLSRTSPPYAGGTQPVAAKSVAYRDGFVYLGLEQISAESGQEFNVIDVRDANQPFWRGGYRIGRTVNDIELWEDRAYLATNARASADVLVLDVANPASITEIARIGLPPLQSTSRFGYAHLLSVYESELHAGRSYVSNADEWVTIDIGDASYPIKASQNEGTALDPASVRGLILREAQAILVLPNRAEVWSRLKPFETARIATVPLRGAATGAVCVGNDIYIVSMEGSVPLLTRLTAT